MDDASIERMIDEVAIRRLYASYADCITRRAFDDIAGLFLPDCEVVVDTRRGAPARVVGPQAFADFVRPAIERFDFFELVILNIVLTFDAADEASGRLYMCEVRHHEADGKRSDAFGVYHDRLRRVDDRWWFAARQYHSLARTAEGDGDRDMDVFPFPDV